MKFQIVTISTHPGIARSVRSSTPNHCQALAGDQVVNLLLSKSQVCRSAVHSCSWPLFLLPSARVKDLRVIQNFRRSLCSKRQFYVFSQYRRVPGTEPYKKAGTTVSNPADADCRWRCWPDSLPPVKSRPFDCVVPRMHMLQVHILLNMWIGLPLLG